VVAGGSCTSGTVTDTGCSMDCSTASINGVTSPTTVLDGQTGVTATCGATGYQDTITVGCPAGTGAITKSGNCECNAGLGYSAVGDACVPQCSFSGTSITGILTTTPSVSLGTGLTQNCNGANFKTTDQITFDCVLGSITNVSGSCTCSDGFTLSGGSCVAIVCSITGVSGFNDKTNLSYAPTSTAIPNTPTTACASGFTGSPTYTCSSPGAAIINSSECVSPYLICTGGVKSCTVGSLPDCAGGKVVHKFTSSGTFSCSSGPSTTALSYLVVGAGGDSGSGLKVVSPSTQHSGGGGGGGQVIYVASATLKSGDSIGVTAGVGLSSNITGTLNGSAINVTAGKGANGGSASGGIGGNSADGGGGGGGAAGNTGGAGGTGGAGNGGAGASGASANGGAGGGTAQSINITGTAASYGGGGGSGDRNLNCQGPNAFWDGRGARGGHGNKTGGGTCAGYTAAGGAVIFSYPYAP
ncbi:MAG: hypothetical protein KA100_07105, partial [Rickettsiales bacterium]|nr:hypothetical protein [Rickettsiales bacterium]